MFEVIAYALVAFLVVGVGLAILILWVRHTFISSTASKITINQDPSLSFTTPSGCTLLSALTTHGIAVPSPCGGKATCKQCRVQIIEGAPPPLQTDNDTFSKQQLAAGWRLSCQTKVKGDLHLAVDEHILGTREWVGVVRRNVNVATFIRELEIELPAGEEVVYRPGAYLQFHVPPFTTNTADWKEGMDPQYWSDWEKYGMFDRNIDFSSLPAPPNDVIRAYSLASYPAEGRKLLFNIRIASPPFIDGKLSSLPWGICSSYAFSLKSGDAVRLSGPYGESFMIDDARELVFLIGGAGSSFGRSHILHLFHSEKTERKVTLWYGARSLKENIYQDEYEALAAQCPNFAYHLVLSEPLPEDIASGWPTKDPIKTNFLFRAFEAGQLKNMEYPEDALFYVCGPPMHNKSVLKLLDDYGVPRESIVLDDFGS